MKTYSEILNEHGNRRISYSALLETKDWHNKRSQIITRENNVCQQCHKPCVDDFTSFKPVIFEFSEVDKPFYDSYTGEFMGTYPKKICKAVVQTDPLFAHVHHSYYVLSRLPWEYSDNDLLVLCHKCHNNLHKTQTVSVYLTEEKLETVNLTPCSRCDGTGHLPKYNYVQNGVCFKCMGACFEEWVS